MLGPEFGTFNFFIRVPSRLCTWAQCTHRVNTIVSRLVGQAGGGGRVAIPNIHPSDRNRRLIYDDISRHGPHLRYLIRWPKYTV